MREGKLDDNFTGSLLSALCEKADDGSEFSDDLVLQNVYSFLFAGLDTTSTALAHTLVHLARHPEIQERARKEALSVDEISYDTILSGLPFLSCVLKEAMRLCPPVSGIGRQRELLVPIKHKGKTIGRGHGIGNSSLVHMRNKAVWGEDAEEFKPTRFWKGEGKSVSIVDPEMNKFTPFSSGIRSCIGKHLAAMEMKIMLWMLLRKIRATSTKEFASGRYWSLAIVMLKPKNGVTVGVQLLDL
mmetsp:Transcript_2968/g.5497  ORF Transcript_2968/g.5497 Transcript_2968/m.5497 type:complete len:243 (-) Transcript_2968:211-939(-)